MKFYLPQEIISAGCANVRLEPAPGEEAALLRAFVKSAAPMHEQSRRLVLQASHDRHLHIENQSSEWI